MRKPWFSPQCGRKRGPPHYSVHCWKQGARRPSPAGAASPRGQRARGLEDQRAHSERTFREKGSLSAPPTELSVSATVTTTVSSRSRRVVPLRGLGLRITHQKMSVWQAVEACPALPCPALPILSTLCSLLHQRPFLQSGRAEPSPAEPSRAQPSRAEPKAAEEQAAR